MIRITSKQDKFIRCRVVHPKGVTNYPDETFNERQLEVLKKEPKLKVEILEDAAAEKDNPAAKTRKGHQPKKIEA
jgi:hypothetical protein